MAVAAIAPDNADVADEKLALVVSLCRSWLQYQSPNMEKRKLAGIAVRAQRYDKEGGHSSLGMGPYLFVLREAQFFWAAASLEPWIAHAATLRRNERQAHRVASQMARKFPSDWSAWVYEHQQRSVDALMDATALLMAERLGGELL